MAPFMCQQLEQERRREAVLVSRRGIGRKLQLMLDDVVQQPVPTGWLMLLEQADRRDAAEGGGMPARRAG